MNIYTVKDTEEENNMLQMSGGSITLQEGANIVKELKKPVVRLGTNFVIDDSVLEKPTL